MFDKGCEQNLVRNDVDTVYIPDIATHEEWLAKVMNR